MHAGGDAFLSICLWQAGYGITDPGYSFYHPEVQMFDPGPEDRMGVMMRLVRALDHRCDETCQVWLVAVFSPSSPAERKGRSWEGGGWQSRLVLWMTGLACTSQPVRPGHFVYRT